MSENSTGKFRSLTEKLNFSRRKAHTENHDTSSEHLPENTVKASVTGSDKYRLLLENIVINGLLNIAEDNRYTDQTCKTTRQTIHIERWTRSVIAYQSRWLERLAFPFPVCRESAVNVIWQLRFSKPRRST